MTAPIDERPSWERPQPAQPAKKKRRTPATKFLWLVAVLISLAFAGWWLFNAYAPRLMRTAFVPRITFQDSPQAAQPDYTALPGWIAHPRRPQSPALAAPPDFYPAAEPRADVFYLGPDTYLSSRFWNDPLDDAASRTLQVETVRHEASAFNSVGVVWAPLIRQASLGAQYSRTEDARAAIDLAYTDVQAAFDAFLAARDPDRPFFLVGHGQGALLAKRLLAGRIAETTLSQSLVAAYLLGWPVDRNRDLFALNVRACQDPRDSRCIVSWSTFADPTDAEHFLAAAAWLERAQPAAAPRLLCTNPLSGTANEKPLSPEAHHGALPFTPAPTGALKALIAGLVGATCSSEGLLIVSPKPKTPFSEQALPGNDFTRYDITLFWADARLDAEARLKAFAAGRPLP